MMGRRLGLIAGLAGFIALAGCARAMTDPSRATRPYPVALHVPSSVDIQVFRRGTSITVVNATPVTYRNASMWINQRFVRPIARLDAGARRTYSLWDFRD
ncbi:MAG: hypothetical protein KDA25_10230, partial [Phycisphaerales bacterium]|nr:hypothetical protein [Phycisphaerales bacterium]